MSRHALALAIVLALSLTELGCGGCPDPQFSGHSSTSWTQSGLVVRWEATPGDDIPDAYYAKAWVKPAPGTTVKSVKITGPRELTIEVDDVDRLRQGHSPFVFQLSYPDQRGYVPCGHPGMNDGFSTQLTVAVLPDSPTPTATFGELKVSRGACAMGIPGEGGDGDATLMAIALVGATLRLRRRPTQPMADWCRQRS